MMHRSLLGGDCIGTSVDGSICLKKGERAIVEAAPKRAIVNARSRVKALDSGSNEITPDA